MYPNPFKPIQGRTVNNGVIGEFVYAAPLNVAASTTAASGQLPGSNTGHDGNVDIRIVNETNAYAFVTFGDGSQPTATVNNGMAFLPGSSEIVQVPQTCNSVSVILSTGSGTVQFMRGTGI